MINLNAGQSYTAKVHAANSSQRLGQPVAAQLSVNLVATLSSATIVSSQQSYNFAAGEAHDFTFPIAIPQGGRGAGAIKAALVSPDGTPLASAPPLDITVVPSVVLDLGNIEVIAINGIPVASVGVSPDGRPMATLPTPIQMSKLVGVSVTWRNKTLNPGGLDYSSIWWYVGYGQKQATVSYVTPPGFLPLKPGYVYVYVEGAGPDGEAWWVQYPVGAQIPPQPTVYWYPQGATFLGYEGFRNAYYADLARTILVPSDFPAPGETRVASIKDTNIIGAPTTAPPGLYDGVFGFNLMGNQGGSWSNFGQGGRFIIKDMIKFI